jgi:hypothetical protein
LQHDAERLADKLLLCLRNLSVKRKFFSNVAFLASFAPGMSEANSISPSLPSGD